MNDQDPSENFLTGCGKDVKNFFSSNSSKFVIVYTSFKIIFRMKKILGLEAMLEYLSSYIQIMEKKNPQLKDSVEQALDSMDMKRIYRDAERMRYE